MRPQAGQYGRLRGNLWSCCTKNNEGFPGSGAETPENSHNKNKRKNVNTV